jgi:hypothetical protein
MNTNQFHSEGIQWFKSAVEPKLAGAYETKYTSSPDGDLGALEGVEFNSKGRGGYVHFWSHGYVGFELVDYESGDGIVEDVVVEWKDSSNFAEVLAPLLKGLEV